MGVILTPRTQAPEPPAGEPAARRWDLAALAALLVVTAAVLIREGRHTGFYYDEWNFVLQRRGWDLRARLAPHNELLSLVPGLVYKILFVVVGLSHYEPYRLCIVA